MKISEFKVGDIIYMSEPYPVKTTQGRVFKNPSFRYCHSYVGVPLLYKGKANGQLLFEAITSSLKLIYNDKYITLVNIASYNYWNKVEIPKGIDKKKYFDSV